MKKRVVFLSVLIILLLSIILIRMNYTGFFILFGKQIEIIRLIEVNESENLTYVKIAVVSSENVIAIQETLSCPVLNYSITPEIETFEFNEQEITWILADKSPLSNIELSYTIQNDCTPKDGLFFIVEGDTVKSFEISTIKSCRTNTECKKTCSEWEKYCSGSSVYKKRTCDTGKCSAGKCTFKKTEERSLDKKCASTETCIDSNCAQKCVDPDANNKNRNYVKGAISYLSNGKYLTKEDSCIGKTYLKENYCISGKPASKQIRCIKACSNGACVK